jgi:hypothetical protein
MADGLSYMDFYSHCDHMPGSARVLRVGGTVRYPSEGWTAILRATDGNTGVNPRMLHLDLVVTPPSGDTPVTRPVPEIPLDEFQIDAPAIEYEEVEFHLVGVEGDAPKNIDVLHTER